MNSQTEKTSDEIYSNIIEFACINDNKSLVRETLSIKKKSVFHNSFFKISCCRKNADISNLFLTEDYSFYIDDEIIEYASIVNCDNLKNNTLKLYEKNNYKPNILKSVIQACKNNSTVWIEYYQNEGFDFSSLNKTELLSILNVCNISVCKFILRFIKQEKIKFLSKNLINNENRKVVNSYLCSLVF